MCPQPWKTRDLGGSAEVGQGRRSCRAVLVWHGLCLTEQVVCAGRFLPPDRATAAEAAPFGSSFLLELHDAIL